MADQEQAIPDVMKKLGKPMKAGERGNYDKT
jgi:hypothetical protein